MRTPWRRADSSRLFASFVGNARVLDLCRGMSGLSVAARERGLLVVAGEEKFGCSVAAVTALAHAGRPVTPACPRDRPTP
jgi:hypothetical protein